MRALRIVGIAAALSFIASTSTALAAPTFAPPTPVKPHGVSYSQWSALWWIWAVGTPVPTNPVLDTTGANCAVAQPAPGVFFLAGAFDNSTRNRTCTVPVGTAFLIPMFNDAFFAQQTDPPEQRTEAFVRSQVTCVEVNPTASLTVDGASLANPLSFLEKSVIFSVNLPNNNVFGVPPQLLSPSADEGYYAFVEPLTPGTHTIHFTGSAPCQAGGAQGLQNSTYTINVQGTVGTPVSCSGSQSLTISNTAIQTNGVALTVSGN